MIFRYNGKFPFVLRVWSQVLVYNIIGNKFPGEVFGGNSELDLEKEIHSLRKINWNNHLE